MDTLLGPLIAIVFIVIAINFVMLYIRLKRDFPKKTTKNILEENEAAVIRDRAIHQKIEREQEDAEQRVMLRNKTLELYEEVRRNAEKNEAPEPGAPEP